MPLGTGGENLGREMEVQRFGTNLGGGADAPSLRRSTAYFSAGGCKCQRLDSPGFGGNQGRVRDQGERRKKTAEKGKAGTKVIKGEKTEQSAKQKEAPLSPLSCGAPSAALPPKLCGHSWAPAVGARLDTAAFARQRWMSAVGHLSKYSNSEW